MGLTAMVGLPYCEGAVTPASSSPPGQLFRQEAGALPSRTPTVLCALSGWKQFLQEPGFHTCSAKSPHADIFGSLERIWSEVAVEVSGRYGLNSHGWRGSVWKTGREERGALLRE